MIAPPTDLHGHALAIGDAVVIYARVTALQSDDTCNLQVVLRQVRNNARTYLSLHTAQVERVTEGP